MCESEALSGTLHGYDYIRGVIFAVAASPEIPMPQQWLLWVFKQRGQLSDEQQADNITDVLMGLLQQQLKDMSDECIMLPNSYRFSENTPDDNNVSRWFRGLLAAHSQLEPVWNHAWMKMGKQAEPQMFVLQKDLRHCLSLFSTFANIPLALEQAAEKGGEAHKEQLDKMLPKIFLSLPESLKTYVKLSGRLVDYLPNQFETFKK